MKLSGISTLVVAMILAFTLSSNVEAGKKKKSYWTPPPSTTGSTSTGSGSTSGSTGTTSGSSTPAVPEPASMALMGAGTAALLYARRRRKAVAAK